VNESITDEEKAVLNLSMMLVYPEAKRSIGFKSTSICAFHLVGAFSVYIDKHVCCIYDRSEFAITSYPSIPINEVMSKLEEVLHTP
jgi:hypothetical protein